MKWAVEVDGFDTHFQLAGGTNDRRRDRKSHVVGWQVERVSPLDLTDVDGVCDELAELYRRRWSPSPVHAGPSQARAPE